MEISPQKKPRLPFE